MADIRNDIADLQSKVYGQPMHSLGEDFPPVPDSWVGSTDSMETGSGEEYRETFPQRGGGGSQRNGRRKREPHRGDSDWKG